MADLEDVLGVLAGTCAGALYPSGTAQPSVVGGGVRIYPGWPVASALDVDLKAGKVNVSLYPLAMERDTTRFMPAWIEGPITAPTVTLTLVNNQVTVGGAVPNPFAAHNLAVIIGGRAFQYSVQATDTLTSIAAGLANAIASAWPLTTSDGPVVTINGVFVAVNTGELVVDADGNPVSVLGDVTPITVRVGTIGTAVREIRRQMRLIQLTVWAPTPDLRAATAKALDALFAKTPFVTMPDGTAARVKYHDSPMTDMLSSARLYRRDLRYFVEYATTEVKDAATVVVGRIAQQDPVTGVNISITDT